MANRRTFLQVGAGASLALALGGGIYRATRAAPLPHPFALDGEAHAALRAIVPVLLAGALAPVAHPARTAAVIEAVRHAILGLPLAAQKDLQDLFGMLALAPARRVLTGISGGWPAAAPADVQAFLQDWRVSQFGMLRAAYGALHDLVLGAWYADPGSWDAIGYPGPILEWAP